MFDEVVILTIFLANWSILYILLNLQKTIPLKIIGQFGLKRCQRKHEVKILQSFFQMQYFGANQGFENSLSTVLQNELDSFFWQAVYGLFFTFSELAKRLFNCSCGKHDSVTADVKKQAPIGDRKKRAYVYVYKAGSQTEITYNIEKCIKYEIRFNSLLFFWQNRAL